MGLFFEGIVAGICQNFFHTFALDGVFAELWLIKKKHIFILLVNFEQIFNQFVYIAANSGEIRGVHSAIDADFHKERLVFLTITYIKK